MFIGERNTSDINIDTDKLAKDIADKINIQPTDPDTIVKPINNHTDTQINNIITPVNDIKTTTNTIYGKCQEIYNVVNNSSGGSTTIVNNSVSPKLLHTEYTYWSVNFYIFQDGSINQYESTVKVPIKIQMFEHFMRIKIYNGLVLKNHDDGYGFILYLDDNHVIKAEPGKEDLLQQYYNKLLETYFVDGSNGIYFPIQGVINETSQPALNKYDGFFAILRNNNNKCNLYIERKGLDAYSYQAFPPQVIITEWMDTGVTEPF